MCYVMIIISNSVTKVGGVSHLADPTPGCAVGLLAAIGELSAGVTGM